MFGIAKAITTPPQ
jgi:hypothetical protein